MLRVNARLFAFMAVWAVVVGFATTSVVVCWLGLAGSVWVSVEGWTFPTRRRSWE
jgi:hypothetical protein